MAPPLVVSNDAKSGIRKSPGFAGDLKSSVLHGRDVTPAKDNASGAAVMAKSDLELSALLTSDIKNIKSLVTCSICDQLLYEPWTLGCGHTYCYSCLCSWFLPNRYKKSCPECRTKVKQMPAPAFLLKQIVEIFTKREELMPSDESVEQHKTKRSQETAEVEKDRNGPAGLFKGTFPNPRDAADLRFDDEDGVQRCSHCGHEYEGGPICQHCGAEFDQHDGLPDYPDFSDIDDDEDADLDDLDGEDLEDLELELNADLAGHAHFFGMGPRRFLPGHHRHHHHHHLFHPHPHHHADFDTNSEHSDGSLDGDSDEDEGSLQDFIVRESGVRDPAETDHDEGHSDDESQDYLGTVRNPLTVDSDDESDEGGAIHRPGRLGRGSRRTAQSTSSPSAPPSAISVTDSCNSSETGDGNDEAAMLREAGWSPLDARDDSDAEGTHTDYENFGRDHSEHGQNTDDESDTETMVGHGGSDDERELSETPRYETPPQHDIPGYGHDSHPLVHLPSPYHYTSDDEQADDDDSDAGLSSIDRDGDTEMSVSPGLSRETRSVSRSTDGYGGMASRSVSVSSNGYGNEMGEHLGAVNQIHEVDEDSSESSIVPAGRRRPRRYHQYPRQQYNPRVSMMFAQHQNDLQRVQARMSDPWEDEDYRVEPASRSRRMTPYRVFHSERAARTPRQYSINRRTQ